MATEVKIPSHWVLHRTNVELLTSWGSYTVEKVEFCRDNEGDCSPQWCKVTLTETLDATQKTNLSDALKSELDDIEFV